ncbi:MAG: magnesium transporter [bacterium]|nr:magnesium transporter [bacterium]
MAYSATEDNAIDTEAIEGLLERGERRQAADLLTSHHPADVAAFMLHIKQDDARGLFSFLTPKFSSEVIIELSDEIRDSILDEMESKRVSEIVDHLASDDAADLLGNLSEEDANRILEHIPEEETRHLKSLLAFGEDTAGGIMQAEVASATMDASVQEVVSMLRGMKDDQEDIHNIFVTDRNRRLKGVLPLRRLVLESPETPILNIMDTDYIAAHVDQDQEEIARLFKKYDLISLPVTDGANKLVGRITVDDVVDVMEEEASEDIFRMAGAGSEDILSMSTFRNAKKRLPWLFASCVGGIVALKIIVAYEHSLGSLAVLASFIPVILGMGGNIGTQSTTIVVRGLAIGSVDVSALWKIVYKEIRIGFILGSTYGLLLALATMVIYPENLSLSLVVGVSMFASMMIATAVGTLIPIILFKSGVDPAVATGPFVTTSIDIIGILILFNFAAFFLF